MANISYQIASEIVTIMRELIQQLGKEKRGRPAKTRRGRPSTYTDEDIVMMLTLARIMGLSLRGIHYRLKTRAIWARLFYFKPTRVPDLATLSRRSKDQRVRRLRTRLEKRIATALAQGRVAVIDASALEASQKHQRHANWGYSSKGMFYGYQLHVVCDLKGAVLSHTVTKASVKNMEPAKHILASAKKAHRKLKYSTGDALYDVSALYRYCHKELGLKLVARINPRRAKTVENAVLLATGERKRAFDLTLSRVGHVLLNKRVVVEQVFSQLKDTIRIDELPYWIKKLSHVKEHIKWLLLAFNVLLLRNKVHGQNLRSIKRLVA